MNATLRVERLSSRDTMTIRARLWSDGGPDQAKHFAAILESIAPGTPAALECAWTPREQEYVASLRGQVDAKQLAELLSRCESENLQLTWSDTTGPTLDVVCELYDDHIEVAARPPLAAGVEQMLQRLDKGAA